MKKNQSILLFAVLAGIASLLTTGIACAQEDIFVSDNGENSVTEVQVAADGTTVLSTTQFISNSPDLAGPTGVAINSAGDLFVANNSTGTIAEFSPGGTFIGNYATGLRNPRGLTFDSAGNLYVATQMDSRVTEIPFGTVPGAGTSFAGQFIVENLQFPNGVAFDPVTGNLYAVSGNGNFLQKVTFSSPGVYASDSTIVDTGLNSPSGAAAAGGNVYVVNSSDRDILEFDADGNLVATPVTGLLSDAHGLAIDGSGNFWVTDEGDNNSISEYSATGQLIQTLADGNFGMPNFIAIESVPEPSAVALLFAGLGVILFINRRRLISAA